MPYCHAMGVAAALAIAAPAAPRALLAQDVIDEGILQVRRGQNVIAREEFRVLATAAGYRVMSTVYYPPRRPRVVISVVLDIGADSMPSMFQMTSERGGWNVAAQFGARRTTFRVESPTGETAREHPTADRTLVVGDSVYAVYAILPGLQTGSVVLTWPKHDRQVEYSINHEPNQATVVDGRPMTLRQVILRADPDRRHLWYDPQGRLMKIELLQSGIVVERIAAQ